MSRITTPHAQPITLPPKSKNNWNKTDSEETEETVAPINAEGGEHLRSKKRESGTEARTEEVVAGGDGSKIRGIRVAQVIEDGGELL